jgi:hypothetical protein
LRSWRENLPFRDHFDGAYVALLSLGKKERKQEGGLHPVVAME